MSDSAYLTNPDLPALRLNPKVQLHWRPLDGDWVVFEVLSGQTHHLDNVTAAILMCYESGDALALPVLLARLQSEFGLDFGAQPSTPVLAAVHQFSALGLIVPVRPAMALHAAV